MIESEVPNYVTENREVWARIKTNSCGAEWRDGWGLHICHNTKGHVDGPFALHNCPCDSVISDSLLKREAECPPDL